MKKSSHANILLLELLVVILFFMISATVIVELFATARQKSIHAEAVNEAMLQAENIAERLYAGGTAEEELSAFGFREENEMWILDADRYTLQAVITEETAEAGTLRTVTLTALKGEEQLTQLPAVRYVPGEVKP